jgi:hypothetical protein
VRKLAPFAALVVLLLIPASGNAATNFGSRLTNEPSNAGKCSALGPCTLVSFIHPSDPDGDPYAGGSPVDGVITKFRVRVFGEGGVATRVTLRVANISRPNPGNDDNAVATAAGIGPTVDVPAAPGPDVPIREFPARLSVAKGQHLGLDGPPNLWATVNSSSDSFTYVFAPPLQQGQGARDSNDTAGELLVAATVEPDSDKDGFGDETQDKCPAQGNGGAACTAPDRKKPSLARLRVSPSSFRALRTGPSLLSQSRGARIRFRLSETATTTFRVQRARTGRRIRGRCRAATRRNKLLSRRRCTRYVRVRGSFKHTDGAGPVSLRFTGRVGGKRLRPGRYRLVARATDLAGNKSAAKTKRFRIKR